MKHLALLILILSLLLASSCKRYPDGPELSLLTVKHRLRGTYRLDAYIVNGIDSINYLTPCFDSNFNEPIGSKSDGKYYYQVLIGHRQMDIRGMDGSGFFRLRDNKTIFAVAYNFYNNAPKTNYPNFWEVASCNDDGYWEILKLTRKEFWVKNIICDREIIMHLTKIK